VLRFRLMVKRGPRIRPQASEGEAQHGPFCGTGRIGQGHPARPGADRHALASGHDAAPPSSV